LKVTMVIDKYKAIRY